MTGRQRVADSRLGQVVGLGKNKKVNLLDVANLTQSVVHSRDGDGEIDQDKVEDQQ